jgi:hypothetical protein
MAEKVSRELNEIVPYFWICISGKRKTLTIFHQTESHGTMLRNRNTCVISANNAGNRIPTVLSVLLPKLSTRPARTDFR